MTSVLVQELEGSLLSDYSLTTDHALIGLTALQVCPLATQGSAQNLEETLFCTQTADCPPVPQQSNCIAGRYVPRAVKLAATWVCSVIASKIEMLYQQADECCMVLLPCNCKMHFF